MYKMVKSHFESIKLNYIQATYNFFLAPSHNRALVTKSIAIYVYFSLSWIGVKKWVFLQTHYQGLRQLFITIPRCSALSTDVPRHRHKQLTQTLIVFLLKTHWFLIVVTE